MKTYITHCLQYEKNSINVCYYFHHYHCCYYYLNQGWSLLFKIRSYPKNVRLRKRAAEHQRREIPGLDQIDRNLAMALSDKSNLSRVSLGEVERVKTISKI